MNKLKTALVVIDVQESFRHRPYFSEADLPAFTAQLQKLIAEAQAHNIPIVQIFHVEEEGPFAQASGFVETLKPLTIKPDIVFYKQRHSAFVGTGLAVWLTQHGIQHLLITGIRTEQCCETTTRHASDLGYQVTFVEDATHTFAMKDASGKLWNPADITARTTLVLKDRFAQIQSVDSLCEK